MRMRPVAGEGSAIRVGGSTPDIPGMRGSVTTRSRSASRASSQASSPPLARSTRPSRWRQRARSAPPRGSSSPTRMRKEPSMLAPSAAPAVGISRRPFRILPGREGGMGDAASETARGGTRFGAAALLLGASVLLSRVLGYAREAVLAYQVGAGPEADAYRAGFQIPDLLNYFLAGGALSVAFVPLYTRALARGRPEAERLLATVLGTIGALSILGTALLWWQAEALVGLQFPRFDEPTRALTVHVTRIVLPAQIFFLTGGIVRAVLMAEGRFGAQAAAPLLYNGCVIAGGLLLAPRLGVEGFAWGALAGAFLGNFLLGWVDVLRHVRLRVRVAPFDPDFRHYLVVAAPLMFGVTLLLLYEWYERWFGGLLAPGTAAELGHPGP